MTERIPTDELSTQIRRNRQRQVMLAVLGMGFFMLALLGGASESRWLAWIGLGGFLICLSSLLVVGILTWRGKRSEE